MARTALALGGTRTGPKIRRGRRKELTVDQDKYLGALGNVVKKLVELPTNMIGAIYDLLEKLGGGESEMWLRALKRFLRREPVWGTNIFRVKVDRTKSSQEALYATGRRQFIDTEVGAAMPKGETDEGEVFFFRPGRFVSDEELERENELRGLKPADPYSLAAVNEADPYFADEHPNCTHWKDARGNWFYAAFDRWLRERSVYVCRSDGVWHDSWWFAGSRK